MFEELFTRQHVMLDLETLGTGPDAAILSIGMAAMDLERGVYDSASIDVDVQSCISAGMTVTASTIQWWMRQSGAAREAAFPKGLASRVPIEEAMRNVVSFIGDREPLLWGNGAGFDNAILRSAAQRCHLGAHLPPFWDDRCFRTFKAQFKDDPVLDIPFDGTPHVAVDDAIHQAKQLHAIMVLLNAPPLVTIEPSTISDEDLRPSKVWTHKKGSDDPKARFQSEAKEEEAMNTYDIFWAPEGRCIATVKAASPETAKRQTPSPYKQYMGEVYVTDRKAPRSDP